MRWRLAALLLTTATATIPATVEAQADTARVIALDSLRITVIRTALATDRLATSISTLDATEIRGGRANMGLDEVLDRVPGLVVNNRYNFSLGSRISIRGLGARAAFGVRGVRIIADGIPLTMPDGQTNLNNLDLGAAGRIDVLRGPASALHGNAAGGVISVSSEAPPPGFSTAARLLLGDVDRGSGPASTSQVQFRAGGPLGTGGYLVSATHTNTDGYRDFSRAEQTLLNAVARQSVRTNDVLTVVLNAADAPVAESAGALPRDSVDRNRRMAWPNNVRTGSGEAVRQAQAGLTWTHTDTDRRTDIAVYGLGRTLDSALPFAWIELDRRAAGSRASFTFTPTGVPLKLTLGVDAEWQRDQRKEWDNNSGGPGDEIRRDQTDHVQSFGPFAQLSLALDDRTDLLVGLRYDAVRFETEDRLVQGGVDASGSRTLSAFSPMAGISRRLGDTFGVFVNLATGFQTPTTTELINAPPADGQSCCPGGFNRSLEPQRATSFEAGSRGTIGQLHFDVALYTMDVRNTIVPFQVAGAEGREFFRNAGRTRHRGLEAALTAAFGVHRASLSYTFNNFTFLDDGDPETEWEGNRLPGIPRHHVFAGLEMRPASALRIDIEAERTGSYFASDANDGASRNDAATVADIRATLDVSLGSTRLVPFVALNNLTNARYNASVVVNAFGGRYFEPAPGRNVHLGVSVRTGSWGG